MNRIIACLAALAALPANAAPPADAAVDYKGQLVFGAPSRSDWRFYRANSTFAEGPQPARSVALDNGQKALAYVSVYLARDQAERDRLLAERKRLDLSVNSRAETIAADTPDGAMKLVFIRRVSSESDIYAAPRAATGSAWAFCTIHLDSDRANWPFSMSMSFDACSKMLAAVAAEKENPAPPKK